MPTTVEINKFTWQVDELKFFTTDLDETMRRHDIPEQWRADVTVTLPNQTKWVGTFLSPELVREGNDPAEGGLFWRETALIVLPSITWSAVVEQTFRLWRAGLLESAFLPTTDQPDGLEGKLRTGPFTRTWEPERERVTRRGFSRYDRSPWGLVLERDDEGQGPAWPPHAELHVRDQAGREYAASLVRFEELDRIPERSALWLPRLIPVKTYDEAILGMIVEEELPNPKVMGELGDPSWGFAWDEPG